MPHAYRANFGERGDHGGDVADRLRDGHPQTSRARVLALEVGKVVRGGTQLGDRDTRVEAQKREKREHRGYHEAKRELCVVGALCSATHDAGIARARVYALSRRERHRHGTKRVS